MSDASRLDMRMAFFHGIGHGLRVIWPVLSGLLLAKAVLGAIVGLLEGWGIGSGVYFAFVTGLTIGYGDLVPTGFATRGLAMGIGFLGVIVTGLVAALAVSALQQAKGAGSKQRSA
jgi:hypothetical protein